MIRKLFIAILILAPLTFIKAQSEAKYRVHFTDKEGVDFDPHAYFSEAAIERRKLHGIPLDHASDRPVKTAYVEKVRQLASELLFKSRWFNMLYVRMDEEARKEVSKLSFVEKTRKVTPRHSILSSAPSAPDEDTEWIERLVKGQTRSLGIRDFREEGLKGKGVRIAVFDNGFDGVKENPVFEHLWEADRILKTRDFVGNDPDVYGPGSHGRMVLSCIAGIDQDDTPIGLAPEAEFLLARTERTLWELFAEEENWLAAAEWADRNGARIINSSLGYTYHRYFPKDMDGTSYVAQAANMAARKGILVVTSAGNSGSDDWRVIGTPADADSALSVGGISARTGVHIDFSSYGPTADGEMKPNLCAYGRTAVASGSNGITISQGTSFSSPLIAGFAACALQSDTSMRSMEFFQELERSGHLYPYYDMAHGYGLPQASYFTDGPEEADPSFSLARANDSIIVRIRPEAMPESSAAKGRKRGGGKVPERLFYHILDPSGKIRKYAVLEVKEREVLKKPEALLKDGEKMRFHYKGSTRTIE